LGRILTDELNSATFDKFADGEKLKIEMGK
jgi:hypothetical protein